MSGRKRIYVDEAAWQRLQSDAGKLAQVNRDLPDLLRQVREHTDQTVARSLAEIGARHERFDQALDQLSEQTRTAEQQAEQRLRDTSRRIVSEVNRRVTALRSETASALAEQREQIGRAIDAERAERSRQFKELDSQVSAMQGGRDRAAQLTAAYLADAAVLRTGILEYPHARYAPGRLDELDRKLAALNVDHADGGVAPFLLANARDLFDEFSALRAEVMLADTEWHAFRCAAEAELVRLQGVIAANTELDARERFDVEPAELLNVDHWSRGALNRLADEVRHWVTRVGDDEPMTTTELRELLAVTVPELDQRLDSIVTQAVTAVRASQLRANLADLIADALEGDHDYQVGESDYGYAGADQRGAFLVKTTNHLSGSEIVIEVEPADTDDAAPTVQLNSYDRGATEEERQARTASIHDTVFEHTGIDLRTTEESAQPDPARQDVERRTQTVTVQVTQPAHD